VSRKRRRTVVVEGRTDPTTHIPHRPPGRTDLPWPPRQIRVRSRRQAGTCGDDDARSKRLVSTPPTTGGPWRPPRRTICKLGVAGSSPARSIRKPPVIGGSSTSGSDPPEGLTSHRELFSEPAEGNRTPNVGCPYRGVQSPPSSSRHGEGRLRLRSDPRRAGVRGAGRLGEPKHPLYRLSAVG
jgi:hypothetical protein